MPKHYFRKGTKYEGEGNFSRAQKNLKARRHLRKKQFKHVNLEMSLLSGGGNEKKREEERGRELGVGKEER